MIVHTNPPVERSKEETQKGSGESWMSAVEQTEGRTENHVSGGVGFQCQEHSGHVPRFAIAGEIPIETCRQQHVEQELLTNHRLMMLPQPALQSTLQELKRVMVCSAPIIGISNTSFEETMCQTGRGFLALP